jgi:hypothetical protein
MHLHRLLTITIALAFLAAGLVAASANESMRSVGAREVVLTPEQTRLIADQLRTERGKVGATATTGSGEPSAGFSVGTSLPVAVPMREFPIGLTTQMPALNGLKYVRLLDRILIVSPAERVVLAEVTL